MKLIDILARELKVWPCNGCSIHQGKAGNLFTVQNGCLSMVVEKADDWLPAEVTRAQWQAAVDALKAESAPVWTGAGLPPVGTVCEMRRTDYVNVDWQEIEFLCAGNKKAFFRDSDGYEWSKPLADLKFRSIRTPEQIAHDEKCKAIGDLTYEICGWFGRDEPEEVHGRLAAYLYDQNFRRVKP